MRKLGLTKKYVNASSQHLLNFTELRNSWILPAAKKYIKYKLSFVSPSSCNHKLLSIRIFSNFLFSHNPNITPQEINRNIILDYLGHLVALNHSDVYRHKLIADLREFLELCCRNEY